MDTLRLGLLSTAAINAQILGGAAETDRVEIVAVGSRDGAKAQAYAAEHGVERAHGSYEALLADEGVDAVYIGLPNGMHHEWTMHALAAGKHVLVEKPFTRRAAEAEAAFAVADAAGLVLMEAFMYRHHPQTAVVRDLVAGGAIGPLQVVKTTFSFALEDLTNVRARPELDGGAMMDVGCYCVSAIRLLAGEPERVSGEQVIGSTGIDMAFHGTLRCADDVIGQFEASFRSPRRQRVEVVGERGTITVEAPFRVDWGGAVLLAPREGEGLGRPESVDVRQANSYRLQLENLADAVRGRGPQLLGRDDAVGQARTIEALYRSADEGRTVAVPPAGETAAAASA
jgi:D-xylose 1-dehydrogenase (NADP+, D-xylono-1,5-lactone-forming)